MLLHPALRQLVLASASPRRQEILTAAGFDFQVVPTSVDERRFPAETAPDYVRRLALAKAQAALATTAAASAPILGADTVVALDESVLGKPASPGEAASMLRLLSGRDHQVLTGVCLLRRSHQSADGETTLWQDVRLSSTTVRFAPLTEAEIQEYVATPEPFDKAGAYAVQGRASRFVERIEGCYFNVVGLPVSLVYRMLKDLQAAMV
jgi:septum formation protein